MIHHHVSCLQFITLPAVVASLSQLAQWSPAAIAAYTRPLIEQAVARATNMGLEVPPAAHRSPHSASGLPGRAVRVWAETVVARLI